MFSSTLDPIDGHQIGQHPLVVRLMKGIYLTNPPKAKYSSTWDVGVVLNYINSFGPNSSLNLSVISKKVAILLALTTLFRVSEIAAIDKNTLQASDARISFALSKVRKAQRQGPLQKISISAFTANPLLCPVRCVRHYVYLTDTVRNETNSGSLLISLRRPFLKVTGSTVARWIKDILKASGVDTDRFTAHSTRGASASRAAAIGVPIDCILRTAHWSNTLTFSKHYHREAEGNFAGAVLSGVCLFVVVVIGLLIYAQSSCFML